MISIIGLVVAAGIFLVAMASHRASLVAVPCGIMAAASIIWMIVFNPSNRLDSLKPSTKKTIYRISFFCMIAFFVIFIAAIRYSYMADTDIVAKIFSALTIISAVMLGFFRRYKSLNDPFASFMAASPQNRMPSIIIAIWSAVWPGVSITLKGNFSSLNSAESMVISLSRYSS